MGSRIDYRVTGLVFVVIVLSLFVLVSAAPPSLSGVVAQFNGTPIEGVNVSVYNSSDGSFVSSNLTDSNGTYFVDISEGDTYYVIFNKTGFVFGNDTYRNVTVTIGGTENMSLNVSLYPENHGSYNFTVYDLVTGLGVEGVNVTVFASTGEVENRTTDADGVALVQVIANNSDFNVTHNITVSRQGYRTKELLNVTVNEGFNLNQVISLEYPQNLSGIVAMFNGSVIDGLNVSIYNSSNGAYVISNLTDLNGSYFISLPVFGTFDVIFNKSGEYVYGNNSYRNVTVTVSFCEEKVLNTSLYPDNHGSYNFTVYDLVTGLLLEDVNITVFASTGEVENGTTDGDGNAFFQVVANNSDFNVTHDISISKYGYRSQVLVGYIVNEGFNENPVVYLDGFRNISGKVTRFNGDSISNMNVSIYNLSTGSFVASNMTDSFGDYFVDLHEWGDFFVIFNKSGNYIYGTSNYRNVSVTVGSSEAKVLNASLYKREYGSYNLTVRDIWNGRPIPNANVTIYPSAYPYNPAGTGFTDESGNVLVVVIANTSTVGVLHNISIIPAGYKSGMLYSESILEGTNKNIDVSMTGECEIYGDIEDSQNNLVVPMIEGAYVELWDRQNTDRVGFGGGYYYGAYSGASGHYLLNYPSTLTGTLNCSAYLHVNASGYVSKNDILVESSIVKDINLTGTAYVSGRIVDASNVSQLISGALVRVINNGSTMYQLYSDSSGAFNVSVRNGVNHTIEISILDYGVYANSTVYNSSVDYGTILLYGLGVLNGTLMDDTNNSILLGGVDVGIVSAGAVYSATTDSFGRFGIIVKDNTQYDISFELNGYFANYTVQYVSNEMDIGSVTLRGKNMVHGVVTDTGNLQNVYVDGTKVELISKVDAKRYITYTDGNGVYSFYVSSMINDYLMRFDKAGYNLSVSNYSMVNDALINENLVGATHLEGTVTDVYSPAVPLLSSVLIEVLDGSDNVYYSTLSDGSGRYSLDIGVDFNYTLKATKDGYQEERVTNLPWDHDRSGTGGADRVQNIAMNGTVSVYVRAIDGFDGMNIDNALVCVLYDLSSSDCFYIKTTGDEGDVRFNIRGGEDYRLKITRYGYPQVFHPSESSFLSGDFSGDVVLEAYAEIYVYDNYALNNKQVYLATVELYTYNDQTDYGYDLNETIVNVSASCNGAQMDGLNVTLVGITHSYYSSQNTAGGSPVVSFRTVPVGDHKLIIDGNALGCGYFEDTINIAAGGSTSIFEYTTDNVAPVISNVMESADPLEFGDTETISADVVDAISSVDYVVIETGGTNYTMTNVTNVTYQYSWTPASVGMVSYVIYASDIWNNIDLVNGDITVQDTTAPTVVLNSPDGGVLSDNSVTFSYTPSDLFGFSGCELWTNTTGAWALNSTNSSPVVNGGVNTIVVSGVGDGTYRWNVNCTDADGNSAFSASDKYFTVDAEAPVLTIESPLSIAYSSSSIWFNITSNKPLVWGRYSLDGAANQTMGNDSLTHFSDLDSSVSSGSHSVIFYGQAYNGRIGVAGPRSFNVDTGNPSPISVEPANETVFFEIAIVNFSITADEPVNLVVNYWNSSNLWTATDPGFTNTVGVQSVPLFNDTYFWNYTICDDAGNCFSDGVFVFYVLIAPDTSPPIPSNEQENNTNPVPGDSVLLSVFWTDDEGLDTAILETNESGVWDNKSVYGSPLALSGTADWSNFTWMNSSVIEGTTVGWRVWASDNTGNWGVSQTRTFTIGDNVPPQSSSVGENRSVAGQGDHILLYAYWVDSIGLDTAILETNESSVWDNKSVYDSPQALSGVEDWSNFTWVNSSVPVDTVVAWRIWANDTNGNWNVTDIMMFVIADASLEVHVVDETGTAVMQDKDGIGVNVTVYNSTDSFMKNTDGTGDATFTEVMFSQTYNISVNGSLRGYGINETLDFVVSGNNVTAIVVNMTKFVVKVVDGSLNPLSGQNVTVYEPDGVTVHRDAGGNDISGVTGALGTVEFPNRVISCAGCNATVDDGGGAVLDSSLFDIIAGNSSNFVQLMVAEDIVPPSSSSVGENRSVAGQGDHILLYAYWIDSIGLDTAILETNESGVWDNKSVYDSPQALSGVEDWSNFTWVNSSVAGGTTVGWRIWANDTSGNWNVTDIITFVIAEASLIVHVWDENGLAVLQDSDGVGVNVTVYNSSTSFMKNTDSTGDATFADVLFGQTYNISVDGSLRGYGLNETFGFVVSGNNVTTVIVNMTKLTVEVVDTNLNPLGNQNVTVYKSNGVTVFKNAGGVNLEGQTGGSGTIIFDRVISCAGCNATVQDALGSVLNSSLIDVIAGNSSNYVQLMIIPTGVSLTVYVNDTSGSPAWADSNGDGVNVTLYNESMYESKNTSTFGYVVFTNLADGGVYNISINGSLQGYGLNGTNNFEVVGDNETTLLLNVTRLIVNVTDTSFTPIANANVSVYLSDNVTAAKNATGGDLTGKTGAEGIVIFNRALPCDDCNVTVSKDDGGVVVNSTRANIIAGNSSNYAWVDPPSDTTFDLNFTLNSDIVPVGVTVSVREYNTSTIVGSNTTDAFGNAVISGVRSGVYDFIIDGEAVGYSKDIYYRNSVGVVIQNTGATDIVGRAKIRINGLFTYYVAVSANGYRGYDDLNVSVSRVGTYDDSINTSGIKPMIQLGLDGNTTISGYVKDANFKVPMNLSYEPVSGAVLRMYTLTSCEVIPSPTLLRYQAVTADNGTYSMIVSLVQQSDPSTFQDYCVNVNAPGFISNNVNDINVGNELNIGLTGDGVVSGYVKTQDNTSFLGGATVLLRSSQCYGGVDGPIAQCSAYEMVTDGDGYFSFNVNSRTGVPSYMPYSVLIYDLNGYDSLDGNEISSLPSPNNYFYLMPASMSTINVSVTSEWSELISDEVSLRLEDNNLVITESDCMLQDNVYVCNINNGDYDLTVNGTSAGYGYYYETDVFLYGPVEKNIVLNVTKVNISLFDEDGFAVSGVNVTIDSVPAVTNATVNGSALFYKVLPGTHALSFTGLADYLGVSNNTIDVVNLGGMNSKVLYANETQFYVNVSNGTAGVGNISVGIGGVFNVTNLTGEILFEKINNSLAGTYFVEFNRTDVYLRGYVAPYPNISVDVLEGLDRETGNNLTVVLNRTSGYGILRVNTGLSGVNVSLWYNDTDYVGHQISGGDGFAFLHANVSVYNSSLYVRAEKSGYNNDTVGPYNATYGNITYVDVTMATAYGSCGHGVITSTCWCGGALYSSGYCCSGSYQAASCDGGDSSGGSSSSTTGGSSPGGVVIIDDPVEVVEDVYDFSVYVGDYYVLSIAKDGSGCVDVPVSISNTGNMVLSNMEMEVSSIPYGFSADFDSFIGVLYPGDERSVVVRVCSSDGSVGEGDSGCTLSVFSGSVRRDAFVTLRIVFESDDILLLLRERLERLGSTLFDIDVSSLTPELKEYYDATMRNLKDAEDYLESEDYEQAGYSLDEAERNVGLLLDGIDEVPPVVDDTVNWYVLLAVALGLAVLSAVLYWFFLRKKAIFSKEPVLPWSLPAGAPVFKLPKIDLSSLKVPTVLLKVLGKHDVYYAHSLARKRYLTDVIEKVLELKCPKCGGKIYQNRCVWCGYRLNAVLRMGDNAEPTRVEDSKASRDFSKGDVYYTRRSRSVDGKGERFVAEDVEHVVERKCSKCGGRVYDGKCVWCG